MNTDQLIERFHRTANSFTRLPLLIELHPYLDSAAWLQLLGECWSTCDNISEHLPALRSLLPAAGPVPELMTAEEQAAWDALPEVARVYRGCGAGNIHGACWSLSLQTAAGFTQLNRYQAQQPLLVTATVAKSRVLAVKLDRQEDELISFGAVVSRVEPAPAA